MKDKAKRQEWISRLAEEVSNAAIEQLCDLLNSEDLQEEDERDISNEVLQLVAKKITFSE